MMIGMNRRIRAFYAGIFIWGDNSTPEFRYGYTNKKLPVLSPSNFARQFITRNGMKKSICRVLAGDWPIASAFGFSKTIEGEAWWYKRCSLKDSHMLLRTEIIRIMKFGR